MTDLAEHPLTGELDDERAETKGERTRRRILELAIDRFGNRGFRATSVSEIARSAGLTQAAAYAYFENKEALFRAAVDTDVDDLIDEIGAKVEDVPIMEFVPSVIVHAVASLSTHPLARRVLEGKEPDEVPRLVELPAMQRFGTMLADALTRAQERGEIRADLQPDVVASGVEALVLGLLFSTVLSGGAAMPRHIAGVVAAFDLMLRPAS